MKKYLTKTNILLILIALVALLVFSSILMAYSDARGIGKAIGGTPGSVLGNALGSVEGYRDGREQGHHDALLNPKIDIDTIDDPSELGLPDTGELEVLEVNIKTQEIYKSEKESLNPNYAILFYREAKVSYFIDLSNYNYNAQKREITLPEVQVKIINHLKEEKELATYKKNPNAGSTIDGKGAWKEAQKTNEEELRKKYLEDSTLIKLAKDNAEKQVKDLFKAINGHDNITVVFEEDTNDRR